MSKELLLAALEEAAEAAAEAALKAEAAAEAYEPHVAARKWDADEWLWECESHSHKEHLRTALANLARAHAASLAALAELAGASDD